MPQKAWSAKRERQYAHVKDSLIDGGKPVPLAEEIAGRRGGLRSHQGPGGRTLLQLRNEARQHGVKDRSSMNKAQLEQALTQ